jgi:AAA-like domain
MRYFNSSGPNVIEQHYTLMRPELVSIGLDYVHKERYFTIWAPRQTGKSTYFRLLATKIEREGYKVVHVNFENFRIQSLKDFLIRLNNHLTRELGIEFNETSLAAVFEQMENLKNLKLVLIIDEVEGINAEYFGDVLHSIRNAYHSRDTNALKSVILVGVSNIVGVVQDNASPFNIADNLNIPYFTDAEVYELLGQHETETGQLFDPSVKAKLSYITANQPGLVNGFAALMVKNSTGRQMITYDDYLQVENFYLVEAIDKNISNIVNKAKTHQAFVERLLFKEGKVSFQIHREEIKVLYVNGIISKDSNGNVMFRVPLYQKCLHKAFYPYMNGESDRISSSINLEEYFNEEGAFLIDTVISKYKEYALRRRFRYFREKDKNGEYYTLKEATLVYSFETYINAFLGIVGGKSYLEAHTGLGRTDLIINVNNHEFVVEAKVYSDITQFKNGKKQLATYAKSLNLDTAIYLVFVEAEVTNKNVFENIEVVDDVTIKTHLVYYNLETDFSTDF